MAIGCIDCGNESKSRSMPTCRTSLGSRTRATNSSDRLRAGQLAVDEQVSDLQEGERRSELLHGVAPVEEAPGFPVDESDRRVVSGRVRITRVEHGKAVLGKAGNVEGGAAERRFLRR